MAGVRIQHPTARNCRFTVVEQAIPYSEPRQCSAPEFGGCGSVHLFKTHHLNIDETGSAIVGDVLFAKIRHLLVLNGFSEGNVVQKPPALGIGIGAQVEGRGAWGNIPIIHGVGGSNG
jgi:hypothetical protein